MDTEPEKLSVLLRRWRDRNGWKQWRAAEVLGVKVSTYANWERGHCEPTALAREAVRARVAATDAAA